MAHPVDVTVGARVRELRIRAGVSQVELGRKLGVSFQQIQKYEKGSNRMGASRLVQVADALGAPLESLFEDVSLKGAAGDQPLDREASKVARDWAAISDPVARQAMRAVMNQLARGGTGDGAVPIRSVA
jgi:transcriptional regulator with XRE-family HTH domain